MWFKQLQLFQLPKSFDYSIDNLINCLEQSLFKSCSPSMSTTMGWINLLDEKDAPLIRKIDSFIMFCLQIEEKILPATVVRHALTEKIKQIEVSENRKIRRKENLSLKDEVIMTLLPRAFSKLTRVYAYIDVKNHWLVLGTANKGKTEKFLSMFKKTICEEIHSIDLKKISPIITNWLKEKNYPTSFAIEKSCVLQDPNQENRVIRCQQQDLFAMSIQSFIKEGCEIKQISLTWHDQITFTLTNKFMLQSIKFQHEIREQIKEMEPETAQQQFDADLVIMTASLSELLKELLQLFANLEKAHSPKISKGEQPITA